MNPYISIIIPVYKSEQFLEKCLNSIINQSFKNIEIIIVNDNSPDGSINIINKYLINYKNIKLINKHVNEGVSVARNEAIKIACGEYILFVDSDDYIEKDALKILYEETSKNEVDIVIFDMICESNDINLKSIKINYDRDTLLNGKEAFKKLLTKEDNIDGHTCNKLIKRELIINNSIFFPENIKIHEDLIFNLKCFFYSNKVKYLNKFLYIYCIRKNSSSIIYDKEKVREVKKVINLVNYFMKDKKIISEYNKEFKIFILNILVNKVDYIIKSDLNIDKMNEEMSFIFNLEEYLLYVKNIKLKTFFEKYRREYIIYFLIRISNENPIVFIKIMKKLINIKNIIK